MTVRSVVLGLANGLVIGAGAGYALAAGGGRPADPPLPVAGLDAAQATWVDYVATTEAIGRGDHPGADLLARNTRDYDDLVAAGELVEITYDWRDQRIADALEAAMRERGIADHGRGMQIRGGQRAGGYVCVERTAVRAVERAIAAARAATAPAVAEPPTR